MTTAIAKTDLLGFGFAFGGIVDKDNRPGLVSALAIPLLVLLALLLELLAIGKSLGLLLAPRLDTLGELLLRALAHLDPFVALHAIRLADHESRKRGGVRVRRGRGRQGLVRSEQACKWGELVSVASLVRPRLLVDVEHGKGCSR